jgi:hypothetical protein
MVSSLHEAMHRIFEEDPALFARAFARIGRPFAEPVKATPLPTDVTEIRPLERRVDSLLQIDSADGGYVLAVEAQSRRDPDKHGSWAYYASYLQEKYRRPPLLLIVCQDESTARWAEGPFDYGLPTWPTLTLRPLVLGPHNLPLITDPAEAAKDISLAALATIAHRNNTKLESTLRALAPAFRADYESVAPFVDFVEIGLAGSPAASVWETLMSMDTSQFKGTTAQRLRAEGREEGREEGRAEGKADDVLRILRVRGLEVSDAERERIATCRDVEILDRWLDRAITVGRPADLFAED